MNRDDSDNEDVVLYEIKKILKHKQENGKNYFLIKWKNWPDDFNSWEEESSLKNVKNLIYNFLNKEQSKENKEIEQPQKKIQEYNQKYGNFKYGDVPLKIQSVEIDQQNSKILNCQVEWKTRPSGEKPLNSVFSNNLLSKKAPIILIDFYETRIKVQKDNQFNFIIYVKKFTNDKKCQIFWQQFTWN